MQTEAGKLGFERRFNSLAEYLYFSTPGIRYIALAPEGLTSFVYPISGNGVIFGYEPPKDQQAEILEDIEHMFATKKLVVNGPLDLFQGGKGLITRQPVYHDNQYWGVVEVAIDIDALLEWAGFADPDQTLDFALLDWRSRLVYGDADILIQKPVVQQVDLLDGSWQLAGLPKGGWQSAIGSHLSLFQIAGILLVGLMSL